MTDPGGSGDAGDGAPTPIDGWCAPGFEPVRAAFAANFAERGEVGAGVHVVVDGEVAVDLVGGWRDEARTQPWQPDTLVGIYSVGKAILSLLALQLVDEGRLGLDQPIAEVWPEFGAGGKGTATVAHALTHRAGVPAIREVLTDDDLFIWERMTAAVAATDAWYRPGERLVYHTNTFGHLVGELVRRVTGAAPGDRLRRVAEPLGADVWFGVPVDQQHRCAEVIWAPPKPIPVVTSFDGLEGDLLLNVLAHLNPPGYSSVGVANTAAWRSAQIGSTSGQATAAGIARIYAGLLQPGRLLSPDLLAHATTPRAHGFCPILGEDVTYGLGFQPTTPKRPLGPNPRTFGHFGTGGSLGFADPDAGVAFGYAMNHVVPRWQSSRNRALMDAVYESIATS
ncbi:serine hydrolase domain-containing protein [Aquihabitans sp. McL0605]|uniref:serine hydrolase domain-containing protein n=1 Tax=Aquihabitans sp. McL0605 TaxID=3415671 RepID=UPI003CFA43F0